VDAKADGAFDYKRITAVELYIFTVIIHYSIFNNSHHNSAFQKINRQIPVVIKQSVSPNKSGKKKLTNIHLKSVSFFIVIKVVAHGK